MMPMPVGRAVLRSKILRREQFAAEHEILNAGSISCQLTQHCIQQRGAVLRRLPRLQIMRHIHHISRQHVLSLRCQIWLLKRRDQHLHHGCLR